MHSASLSMLCLSPCNLTLALVQLRRVSRLYILLKVIYITMIMMMIRGVYKEGGRERAERCVRKSKGRREAREGCVWKGWGRGKRGKGGDRGERCATKMERREEEWG